MPSYEASAAEIIAGVTSSDSGLSSNTQAIITDIINSLPKTDNGDIVGSDFTDADSVAEAGSLIVNVAPDAPLTTNMMSAAMSTVQAVIMQATAGAADLTLSATSPLAALVLSNADNHKVVFTNDQVNVAVSTGSGANTQVTTAGGNDAITFTGGSTSDSNASATINTGEGDDHVALTGFGSATINAGSGNATFAVEGDGVSATINAGDGFDQLFSNVRPGGSLLGRSDHTFEFVGGRFVMHSDGEISMQDVNLVMYGSEPASMESINPFTNTTVLATNEYESLVAKLYNVAMDRTAGVLDGQDGIMLPGQVATDGITFWTDYIQQHQNDLQTRDDLAHFVYSFLNTDEFHDRYDLLTNAQYVQSLFSNMGLSATDNITDPDGTTHSMQDYINQINAFDAANTDPNQAFVGRYDVAWELANSKTTVEILGINGNNYVIDGDFTNDGNANG